MNGDITLAIEVFEAACDTAIARLGEENAYRILCQRKERAQIISKLLPLDKRGGEKMFTRGVTDNQSINEEIKALNKSMGVT